MYRVLNILAFLTFASTLFIRSLDPVIPQIAGEFAAPPSTVALIATAFTLPYALVQPILGSAADVFGKMRLMLVCQFILVISGFVGAFAPDLHTLVGSRIVAGVAAGGIFPTALALVGDLAPVHQRQVAISRLLAASMTGNLLGASFSGLITDFASWRGTLILIGLIGAAAFFTAFFGLRGAVRDPPPKFDAASIWGGYRTIIFNPLAKICFAAVFIEAIFLFGMFPHMANLLHGQGETRASIAGVVIAGFGIGGLAYTFAIPWMLPRLGERRLMIGGGSIMALTLLVIALRAPWQADFLDFMAIGFSFYMLHGCIQVYVTELAPKARSTAAALHSAAFFLGQAFGPVVYREGFDAVGLTPMMWLGAAMIFLTGIVCAFTLRRPPLELEVHPRPR